MRRSRLRVLVAALVASASAFEASRDGAIAPSCGLRAYERQQQPQQQQQQQKLQPVLRHPRRRLASAPALQAAGGGWHAAGGVGALALGSEVIQVVNTFVALLILHRVTGADTFVGLVEVFASYFSRMGWLAYPAYSALLLAITILPLMSAILFIVLAGMVFGPLRGTVVVSLSLSTAAAVSAGASRRIAAAYNYGLANIDPRAAAVDAAISRGPPRNGLLLVTLLRLSPVLPFTFSNYLAGLTSLPLWVIFLGTTLGTLPTQAVYVGAGALGRQALEGGVKMPKAILALGGLATVAAIVLVGHVAQKVLSAMELEKRAGVEAGNVV